MKSLYQRFFDYFLIGVLGLLPVVIVFQVVFYIEGLLRDFLMSLYGRFEHRLIFPVLLFLAAVMLTVYFGYLLKQDKAHLLYYLEKLLDRVPVLGTLYRVTKKIMGLFRGDEDTKLQDVVYVQYPKDGLWVPAFVTNKVGSQYVVYIPTSPNPTSGFTVILDESQVIHSRMTIEEATSFVISLGVDLSKPGELSVLQPLPAGPPPQANP